MLFQNKEPQSPLPDENHWHERVLFIGLMIIIAVMPLIVRAKIIDHTTPMISIYDTLNSGTAGELFTYYKYITILIVSTALFAVFMYRLFFLKKPLIRDSSQYFMMLFAVVLSLSALYSSYSWVAVSGVFNRHDGSLIHIASIVLFLIAANLTFTTKRLYYVAYGLAIVVVINTALGTYNFYGGDMLQFSLVQEILLPSAISADQISDSSSLQATLNNPNYVSGLAGMSGLFFMFLAVFHERNIHQRLFFLISLSAFALLFTSTSQSGFLTIFIGTVILAAVILLVTSNRKKTFAIRFAGLIGSFFIILFVFDQQNERVWSETVGSLGIDHPFRDQVETPITGDANLFGILSGMLSPQEEEQENEQEDERVIALPDLPESGISAGSGRLYIWNRTVHLILDKPMFGHGMDTILYTFPQHEPEKVAGLRRLTTMVDKPHNNLLGIAYGAGIPAMVAFLAGVMTILGKGATRLYRNKDKPTIPWIFLGAALMFTTGYLIQGIGNDPIIGTLPLFWIIAGVAVALMYQQQETSNLQ